MPKQWQEVAGKDFRKHFAQWHESANKINNHLSRNTIKESHDAIADHQNRIKRAKTAINSFDPKSDEGAQNIKLRKESIAYRKADIAKHQQYLDSVPKASQSQLEDSKMLYEIFATNMQGRSLVGVKMGKEMGAAAAIIPKKDHIYIDFLMTNPKTLIDGKSKGAGTAAIKAVAKKSMDMGKGGAVKLWAVNSAIPFYEKVGFVRDSPSDNHMTLHPQSAKKLLGV